ncbi:hypothetical protein LJR234_000063 [Mesorhizobium amorphae]|uniref:hypothetical protein n=1 Tax=Mesorhizobium amorphae TaxID=71433 RepID=UPI003ED13327
MKRQFESPQPSLFEVGEPSVMLTPSTGDRDGNAGARGAFVYIRQSTPISLCTIRRAGAGNTGSLIALRFRATPGGDLRGHAGAVFAIEASRLARNGRDWHTLIEFCGLVGAVVVDKDAIYDPRHPMIGCCLA